MCLVVNILCYWERRQIWYQVFRGFNHFIIWFCWFLMMGKLNNMSVLRQTAGQRQDLRETQEAESNDYETPVTWDLQSHQQINPDITSATVRGKNSDETWRQLHFTTFVAQDHSRSLILTCLTNRRRCLTCDPCMCTQEPWRTCKSICSFLRSKSVCFLW